MYIEAICPEGCFTDDTAIALTTDVSITAGAVTEGTSLMSLADALSIEGPTFTLREVIRTVHGREEVPVHVFGLENGHTLRVTQNHPLVLANGIVVAADTVTDGASLLAADGKPVRILSHIRSIHDGEVVNFALNAETQTGHVVVAEGVLSGDLVLQNIIAGEKHAISIRQ